MNFYVIYEYLCVHVCVLHVFELIYEVLGKIFDLVNIKGIRCPSEGNTLRCIQYEEKVNRTLCSQSKQILMSAHNLIFKIKKTIQLNGITS